MSNTTPLTDAINALTTYANETTGASDTNLSDAVGTLISGYGGGGGDDTMGQYLANTLTNYSNDTITNIPQYGFAYASNLVELSIPNVERIGAYAFMYTGIKKLVIHKTVRLNGWQIFGKMTNLEELDIMNVISPQQQLFIDSGKMSVLIIRDTNNILTLVNNTNVFNNTPFASGKSGGTLYVPQSLISSYQSATTWSTILSYANNSIQAIEGSIYETQYADGTPIS